MLNKPGDVLDRLAPSLEKHKGCDLIELNPGIGIWSTKLHNHLQPRTHIMFEPEAKIYQPFLDPLLSQKGTTLYPKQGHIWSHLEAVLTPDFLPHQKPLPEDDPRLEEPNNTLLFVANLAFNPRKAVGQFRSVGALINYQLLAAVRAHSLFHRYGLIRMLIWMHDQDRDSLLPTSVCQRRTTAVHAEATCSSITEVAGANIGQTRHRNRFLLLEVECARNVLKRMEEAKIKVPEGRENYLLKGIQDIDAGKITLEEFYHEHLPGEFREAEDIYMEGKMVPYQGETRNGDQPASSSIYAKLMNRRSIRRLTLNLLKEFPTLYSEYESTILEREAALRLPPSENSTRQSRLEAVTQRLHALQTWIESLQPRFHAEIPRIFEDKKALTATGTPLLYYDRRPYEPLVVHPQECHPLSSPCLLDIQPRSLSPILRQNYPRNWEVFEHIASTINAGKTSVKDSISSLAPNAWEYFGEGGERSEPGGAGDDGVGECRCSILKDPSKGGDRDLNKMPTRLLTQDMLLDLTREWTRWPFRPGRWDLLARQGREELEGGEFRGGWGTW